MDDFVLIDESVICEDDLRELVDRLASLKGTKAQIHTQWQVACDDVTVMVALDALLGCPAPEPAKAEEPKPTGKRNYKSHKSGKGVPVQIGVAQKNPYRAYPPVVEAPEVEHHQIRTWEVHIPGVTGKTTDELEKITIDDKNHRLETGKFETGTLLRHPKSGFNRVLGEKGTIQTTEPITTEAAITILDA